MSARTAASTMAGVKIGTDVLCCICERGLVLVFHASPMGAGLEARTTADLAIGATASDLEGELRRGPGGDGLGLGGEVVDEALEDEALVGGRGAQLEVGAGDEAQGAGEVAAALVAAGLADEVVGCEGRDAEALPES